MGEWCSGLYNNYLIYLLNAKASVTVNPPVGIAPVVLVNAHWQAGHSAAPILNNCSLDTICRDRSGYQMGYAVIKPMEFVDDLVDPNHNIQSDSVSNQIIQPIQHEMAKFLYQKM